MNAPTEGDGSNIMRDDGNWRLNLLESEPQRWEVLRSVHRVAILGIKPEHVGGAAFDVPAVMQHAGYEIIPVPVYYPEVTSILGEAVHRTLSTIAPVPDMVVLFRRPSDIPQHLDELLAVRPRVVWMQLGIRHDTVAEALARAGIRVVQDACVKIDLARQRQ